MALNDIMNDFIKKYNNNKYQLINIVGGQDLNFCVGLKTPFTNESTSEEEKTFGKAPYYVDK